MTQDIARQRAYKFNRIREYFQDKVFTRRELEQVFKQNEYPFSSRYVRPLIDKGALINIGHKIKFPAQPVHYTAIMEAVNLCNKQQQERRSKTKPQEHTNATCPDADFTAKAIQHLKDLGYKILKPTITYDEL